MHRIVILLQNGHANAVYIKQSDLPLLNNSLRSVQTRGVLLEERLSQKRAQKPLRRDATETRWCHDVRGKQPIAAAALCGASRVFNSGN